MRHLKILVGEKDDLCFVLFLFVGFSFFVIWVHCHLLTYLFKWEGSGALKICQGTTQDESKTNVALCQQILDDKEVKALSGVYRVTGGDVEGIVTLDSVKAKRHISSIMGALRKPTAYQKRWNVQYIFSDCFSNIVQNKHVVEHPYQPCSTTSH